MGRVDRHEINISVLLGVDSLRYHVGRVGINGARLEDHFFIRGRRKVGKFNLINIVGSGNVGDQDASVDNATEVEDERKESEDKVSNERKGVVFDGGHDVLEVHGFGTMHHLGGNPTIGNKDEGKDGEEDGQRDGDH